MITREFYLNKIQKGFHSVPIILLIGARQVGKTSLMKMYSFDGKSVFLNGQDPEIAELFTRFADIENYLKVYLDNDLNGLLYLDEFQFITGISTMLKLLSDKYSNLKILCSGSSSLDVLQKVNESLAGRIRVIEVQTLTFEEYLLFKDKQLHDLLEKLDDTTSHGALTLPLQNALMEYLIFGGLPRAAKISNKDEKIEILNDIYTTYLLRDVRYYINNQDFIGFNKLLRILASQIGNLVNINELSRSSGLAYKKCEEYVFLLQQMYIISMVEPYETNKRKAITKMKKVYFMDLGLRNMIHSDFNDIDLRQDKGALFENYIFLELKHKLKSGAAIQFYRTSDGTEVDFVLNTLNEKIALESKFKSMSKATNYVAMNNFCDREGIINRIIINQTLNTLQNGMRFIQGYFVSKI